MGIITEHLSKSVSLNTEKEIAILSDITFKISDGEMVAIEGKSGAGKSTLLHILGLLDSATSGNYYLDNADVSNMSKSEKSKHRNNKFGFVMQDFALINDESVLDNIILPAIFANKKIREAKQKAQYFLKNFGMSDLQNRKVGLLSGGEKQRIAILRSLINDPPYILADEPTGALDTKNSEYIMDIFVKLNLEYKKTIIIVTHDRIVSNRCDRTIYISDGVINWNQVYLFYTRNIIKL